MNKPKIVLIGHVCIDRNKSENASYEGWGSSVIYMANYLAIEHRLKTNIITSYGADILRYLPAGITLMPETPSLNATLVYANDSRSGTRVQHCFGHKQSIPSVLDGNMTQTISEADIIIVAPLLDNYSKKYLEKLLESAKTRAIKVLCPQGYFRNIDEAGGVSFQDFQDLSDIVPLFDLVFYSEEDHPAAFELAKQWSHNIDTQFVVTQGAAGASIIHQGEITAIPTVPIPPEQVVDSVGCGDVFAASATYNYYLSRDLLKSIQVAHEVARAKLLTSLETKNT